MVVAAMALTLIASACVSSPSSSPTAQPSVAGSPPQATIRTAPPASVDLNPGDTFYRATLTGAQTWVSIGQETTDTATTSVDVTFKAIQGDIAGTQVQGGTMSISDTVSGYCVGTGTFAGVIQPSGSELDRVTPASGDGFGDLVMNRGDDGISRNPGDAREAISFLILLTVQFHAQCGESGGSGATSVSSCLGDRSTSTTFILHKTGPGTFAGTCHDDFHGDSYYGTLDWSGEAHQISP